MKSNLIDKILAETPLEVKLNVSNEMAFINLITALGYRENKTWSDDDEEDTRVMTIIMRESMLHTHNQMKDIRLHTIARELPLKENENNC